GRRAGRGCWKVRVRVVPGAYSLATEDWEWLARWNACACQPHDTPTATAIASAAARTPTGRRSRLTRPISPAASGSVLVAFIPRSFFARPPPIDRRSTARLRCNGDASHERLGVAGAAPLPARPPAIPPPRPRPFPHPHPP